MTDIGKRIKEARKAAGLTQKALAEKSGMAYQQIGQYESGKRKPRKETLQKIYTALNYSDIPSQDEHFDAQTILMLNIFSRLNSDGKAEAIKRVEEMAELERYQARDGEA